MKKYLLLLIIGFGYSQANGFSIYGVGERTQNTDPSAIGLGNSSFFQETQKVFLMNHHRHCGDLHSLVLVYIQG